MPGPRRRLPRLTGPELIDLLVKDGWQVERRARHGARLSKRFPEGTRVTVVPTRNDPLPIGTLNAVLGPKQTGLGRDGLLALLDRDP